MDPFPSHAAQFIEIPKRLARLLLAIGENRVELLSVELQEERKRLLCAILLALGVAAFGLLAGVGLTAAIAVLFWKLSPLLTLLGLTVVYGVTALCLYWRLARLLRDWQVLAATLDQLRKDRVCLEKHLTQARLNYESNC
jgi:uncharacterized membrane protein YqjE